jgi:Tol biopolymer transport system component
MDKKTVNNCLATHSPSRWCLGENMCNSWNFGFQKAVYSAFFCIINRQNSFHRFRVPVLVLIVLTTIFVFFGCGKKGSSSAQNYTDVPEQAVVLFPPVDTYHVSVTPLLQWEDGGGTDTYDVYLGTSEDNVTHAESVDDTFMGNQSDTSYASAVKLAYEQDYYWRIDSINEDGKTKGDVWHFRTYNQYTVDAKNAKVHSIETIIVDARNSKWSPDGSKISFMRLKGATAAIGSYEVYLANPDGSGEIGISEICPDLSTGRHKGAASWHPSGQWLLLVVEKDNYLYSKRPDIRALATVGIGLNTDMWLLAADGSRAWRLTNVPTKMHAADTTPFTGILHPQFSHSGTRVLYGFTEDPGEDAFGDWELRIADFSEPSLALVDHDTAISFEPGEKKHWYESHGWSTDDSMIYFSFSPNPQQDDLTTDIGVFNLSTAGYENLTDSWQVEGDRWDGKSAWDEHAYLSKDGSKLAYISNKGFPMFLDDNDDRENWRDWLITEIWWMGPMGEEQEQVSYFNDPTAPEFAGSSQNVVGAPSWNPETTAFTCVLGTRNQNLITGETLTWDFDVKIFWLDLNQNGLRDADE